MRIRQPSRAREPQRARAGGRGRGGSAAGQSQLVRLQRDAGNRAVTLLVQRDGPTSTADAGVPLPGGVPTSGGESLPGGVAESPRTVLDRALRDRTVDAINGAADAFRVATDAERVTLLEVMVQQPLRGQSRETVMRLWASFRPNLTRAVVEHSALWDRCNAQGARLPDQWLGPAAGTRRISATEQVGGWEYGIRGAYEYRVMADRVEVRVPIAFQPDRGVTVPTAAWFGHIRTTWNHFSAVDTADPTRRKRIEFVPSSGGSYHRVRVAAGDGRANAGLFYESDSRASHTIPHEFGHLIGLEDEYERDAADYRRVTGRAPQAGDASKREQAIEIARELRNALFIEERLLEFHTTATERRLTAVNRVFNNRRLPRNYSSPLTRQIATEYHTLYSSQLTTDIRRQIDRVSDISNFRDWREGVIGAFQFTSTSVMGSPSYTAAPGAAEHSHGVEERHVRGFARHVQEALGGSWQPRRTH